MRVTVRLGFIPAEMPAYYEDGKDTVSRINIFIKNQGGNQNGNGSQKQHERSSHARHPQH